MEENNNNKTFGELAAEIMMPKLKILADKNLKTARTAGFKKIKEKIKAGGEINWRCGVCREFVASFKEEKDIPLIKEYLKKIDKNGYIPCPKNGKHHLLSISLGKDGITFETKELFKENKPVNKKPLTIKVVSNKIS